MDNKRQRIEAYQKNYLKDYDFEKIMVWARQKYLVEYIEQLLPEIVIEVGCGKDQLFTKVAHLTKIKKWFIVEPALLFFREAKKLEAIDSRVMVIKEFVEDIVKREYFPRANLCICSGLLNEVEKPTEILDATKKLILPDGHIHINVPNALSFHRQLAYEMGIIKTVHQFSDRNKNLLQFHVYDRKTLRNLIESSSLKVEDEGGYFIKPFTHEQMVKVLDVIKTDNILEGCWKMGRKYPELASEIFVNVGLP